MAFVSSGRCKLAEFVTYHILSDIYRYVFAPVMDGKCMAYKIRENGGSTAPGFEHNFFPCFVHLLNTL